MSATFICKTFFSAGTIRMRDSATLTFHVTLQETVRGLKCTRGTEMH